MAVRGKISGLFNRSFAFKIVTALAFCILTVSVVLSVVFIQAQVKSYDEMLMERGALLAGVLAHNVRLGVFSSNEIMMKTPVEGIMGQKGVMAVAVYDMFGNILIKKDRGEEDEEPQAQGVTGSDVGRVLETLGVDKRIRHVHGDRIIEFWAAVVTSRDLIREPDFFFQNGGCEEKEEVIGAVKVSLKRNMMREFLTGMVLKIVGIGGSALLVGIFMALFLVSGITKPLRRLAHEVYLLGVSGPSGRVTVERDDEIGRVATAFNTMAAHLEKERMLQVKLQRDLEKQVEDRTAYIRGINEQLMTEIRERVAVHQALREREELYRGVFKSSKSAFVICDENKRIVDVNEAAITIYGYPHEEFKKLSLNDLMHPEHYFFDGKAFKAKIGSVGFFFTEAVGLKRDGAEINVEISVVKYSLAGNRFVFLTIRDVTKTKVLQEQLIRSERLVATGKLASSVAHEVNSPLQGITSLLGVIRKNSEGNDEMINDIDLIRGAFMSIKNTVKKLMDLSRGTDEGRQVVDIHSIIRDTAELVRGYLRKNRIEMQLDFCSHSPLLLVSPQKLGQCFMNLINNSVEAMVGEEGAGARGSRKNSSDRKILVRTAIKSEKFVIEFEDTGNGIADEDLAHLFEPFYTRRKRNGMGVGLAICQEVVEHHQGTINASNSPRGALFTIELPFSETAAK